MTASSLAAKASFGVTVANTLNSRDPESAERQKCGNCSSSEPQEMVLFHHLLMHLKNVKKHFFHMKAQGISSQAKLTLQK